MASSALSLHQHNRMFPFSCRYFICDEKLAALGWQESTSWEDGLRKTVDWYLKHDMDNYWKAADIRIALQPHPTDATSPLKATAPTNFNSLQSIHSISTNQQM